MNVLVLITRGQSLHGSGFQMPGNQPLFQVQTDHWQEAESTLSEGWQRLIPVPEETAKEFVPDILAVRVPYGGDVLQGPTVVQAGVLAELREIVDEAPLHLPRLLRLVEDLEPLFPKAAIVLLAETAFFADLPAREARYGLNPDLMNELSLRRYGFHGLYHEAAAAHVTVRRRQKALNAPVRLLSICLEPRPEIAAIMDHRPIMVTGGASLLEGIPGETTCGEIDPSIVLTLAQKLRWGPEQIDQVLTKQSGLLGLVGRLTSWNQLFGSDEPELAQVRRMVEHHFLRACGAGMAALGGLDAIVFSGRYFECGQVLGPWLQQKLAFKQPPEMTWECFERPLEPIMCEAAVAAVASCPV